MPDRIENEATKLIKIDVLKPPNEAIFESEFNQNPFFKQKWDIWGKNYHLLVLLI